MSEFSYEGLYALLEGRNKERPEGSYTTYLFEKGLDKILKKVGEECTEVIIAAKDQDHKETVYEIADLAYHVMVLMVASGANKAQAIKDAFFGPVTPQVPASILQYHKDFILVADEEALSLI